MNQSGLRREFEKRLDGLTGKDDSQKRQSEHERHAKEHVHNHGSPMHQLPLFSMTPDTRLRNCIVGETMSVLPWIICYRREGLVGERKQWISFHTACGA